MTAVANPPTERPAASRRLRSEPVMGSVTGEASRE